MDSPGQRAVRLVGRSYRTLGTGTRLRYRACVADTERQRRQDEHAIGRLEAFSDGVFAIAATILVLDLTVDGLGEVGSDADLWSGLLGLAPNLIAFVVSFILLCLLWWIHTRSFEDIVRVDGVFVVLNSLRLLGVVLIPFTTDINSEFVDLGTGAVYLAVNFAAVVIIGAAQTWWATTPGSHMLADVTEAETRAIRQASIAAVVLSIAAVLLSPFVGSLAFLVFMLDRPLGRLLQRRAAG